MNWRKYIDKLLYNLKLKFKSKEELLTEEVLTFNFKYSDIKDINIKYEFIDKDIITSIQKIKLLLEVMIMLKKRLFIIYLTIIKKYLI